MIGKVVSQLSMITTPLVGIDTDDPLQRFGYVKVEGTSFTVSEPFTPLEIEPILYTYATEEQRKYSSVTI